MVEGALQDFAAWSGREEICVSRIEVREEITTRRGVEVGGRYNRATGGVLISAQPGGKRRRVFHELCHALETSEGLMAEHGHLFDPTGIDDELYPTEADRTEEAFALFCEEGPTLYPSVVLDEACETDEAGEEQRFVMEVLWPGSSRPAIGEPIEVVFGEPVPLDQGGAEWSVGPHGELYALQHRASPRGLYSDLVRLDPQTGELLERWRLGPGHFWELHTSDTAPLLSWQRERLYSLEQGGLLRHELHHELSSPIEFARVGEQLVARQLGGLLVWNDSDHSSLDGLGNLAWHPTPSGLRVLSDEHVVLVDAQGRLHLDEEPIPEWAAFARMQQLEPGTLLSPYLHGFDLEANELRPGPGCELDYGGELLLGNGHELLRVWEDEQGWSVQSLSPR